MAQILENLEDFSSQLKKIFALNGLEKFADEQSIQKFHALTLILQKANAEMNLTAINDTSEIILKHYADSLLAAHMFEKDKTIIDIGCGAGFPSLPLAIVRPDLKITPLDSTGKKIEFVRETAKRLELANIDPICQRAEEYLAKAQKRESYDYATARAVSRLNILSELALPFVKIGGSFIALKAKEGESELSEAEKGIGILGGRVEKAQHLTLSDADSFEAQRVIIEIKKVIETPKKYPRQYAKIAKKPI